MNEKKQEIDYVAWALHWKFILSNIVNDFRKRHPKDSSSDEAIIIEFLEFLVKENVIKKENGKYVLPKTTQ